METLGVEFFPAVTAHFIIIFVSLWCYSLILFVCREWSSGIHSMIHSIRLLFSRIFHSWISRTKTTCVRKKEGMNHHYREDPPSSSSSYRSLQIHFFESNFNNILMQRSNACIEMTTHRRRQWVRYISTTRYTKSKILSLWSTKNEEPPSNDRQNFRWSLQCFMAWSKGIHLRALQAM